MPTWLLVPAKSLTTGKSRLESVLDDGARRALNAALLARILDAASRFPGSARTAVASGCQQVLDIAAAAGVATIRHAPGIGLNAAVGEGVRLLRARGAGAIVVAAADLPLVRAEALREIAAIGERSGHVVVCADKHHEGTNALYLPAGVEIDFRFGPGSCAAHLRAGAEAGIATRLHFDFRVAFDVDTPDDLERWSALESGPADPASATLADRARGGVNRA